jgi:hypothetical protein
MTIGPGHYDDLCTEVREKSHAAGAVVIIFGGTKGHGFSCQVDFETMIQLPDTLETMARQIREDTKRQSQ